MKMKPMNKHLLLILLGFGTFSSAANEWNVDVLTDSVSVSIDGNISAGDKYRILFNPKSDNPCELITQVTTFYSVVKDAERKFKKLPSNYVLAQVNRGDMQEKFIMQIENTSDFIAGKRTLFTVSTNTVEQFLDFHKDNETIEIELLSFYDLKNQKRVNKNITDYFDIPKNSWSLDGVDKSLNKAKSECKKLK